MSRRYDSRTTIFSPEGRLYQVEYAQEAISNAGTAIGILSEEGVVLACEKKFTSKLLDDEGSTEKLYILNDNMICAVAGMNADASILVNRARVTAQQYLKTYNEEMPCEMLIKRVCDVKQGYTQHGGLRPFGVSFLYAGYDDRYQFQLFTSNPSGNYSGWKATSIGANNSAAQTLLKKDYKNDLSLKDACDLAIKVLSKTMDSSNMNSEKLEFATLSLSKQHEGKVIQKIWKDLEIDALIKDTGVLDEKNQDDD
ncbi:N-terminal nucleophile aminohydrolase [Hyphopichia burtonii NRRL Y-1933]|uniref:Proteasome subunit alpha type n=1 Tax=Hyphopichia burtonii NRRL Y-1933 TaxID=984485 RepID=A0A1E4RGS8_9ASCO|nr:N-terminal nucleophile aminohydrolase [Hyphopichia burtonii NRRL Y-1933]ODV66477.1 N-terminal nucleophile aminohydrolase [Hyphopichia burtonii NRRL Y-1933]